MQRNEETLSTRDLASTNDEVTDTAPASDSSPELGDESSPAPATVYDREAADRDGPGRATGPASPAGPVDSASTNGAPLLTEELSITFQRRWEEVQTRFVDEPRGAVEEADGLVANLMQQLAEGFAQERERLEAQWGRGEDISTEDLRIALQRYRSFFQRLLST
jgi:hypothetical protein